jgi:hypothetical protein
MGGDPGILGGQGMKEIFQSRINKPFPINLKKTGKSQTSQTLEGQTDRSASIANEDRIIRAPQRICAWCNSVMREGTKPATHGMCPKCLEEQMHSPEGPEPHSGPEVPVGEISYNPVNPGSYDRQKSRGWSSGDGKTHRRYSKWR